MPRPKIPRFLRFNPDVYYFKPRGVPLRFLDEVVVADDELEAIKLYDVDSLDQHQCANRMKISQPTFARILRKGRRKIAGAIVFGRAIRIEKG